MNCSTTLAMLLAALSAVSCGRVVGAATYTEVGDAGPTPDFVQDVAITGHVEAIGGRIEHAFDADLYRIMIDDPSAFSATTAWAGTDAPDLQLFLFDAWGRGVAANDNWLFSPQPQFPAGTLLGQTPGVYLLGVSPADDDPLGVFGEIFPEADAGVSEPTGPSRIDSLLDWSRDYTAVGGNYSIGLAAVSGFTPPLEADFDDDGDVDDFDLAAWTDNFGLASGASHTQGDADRDLDVDGGDFLLWQRQAGSGGLAAASSAAVPEPAANLLGAVVGVGWAGVEHRRRTLRRRTAVQ